MFSPDPDAKPASGPPILGPPGRTALEVRAAHDLLGAAIANWEKLHVYFSVKESREIRAAASALCWGLGHCCCDHATDVLLHRVRRVMDRIESEASRGPGS